MIVKVISLVADEFEASSVARMPSLKLDPDGGGDVASTGHGSSASQGRASHSKSASASAAATPAHLLRPPAA